MRYIGLDLGKKTLGVAVSENGVAVPKVVFQINSLNDALEKVKKLETEYGAFEIALGLPLNFDDSIGEQARFSLKFKKLLEENNYTVYMVDERNTTLRALEVIREMNVSKEKKKALVDKIAAQFILKYFLEKKERENNE